MYTDGDNDDVTLNELKSLALLYPKSVTTELANKDMEATVNRVQKQTDDDPYKSVNAADDRMKQQDQAVVDWEDLDEIRVFEKATELLPPIDVAAETTLRARESKPCKKKWSENDSSSDEEWLTEVATGLLVSSKPLKQIKRKFLSQESELIRDESAKNVSLADIKQGERHGCKVVNTKIMENGKHIVAEVSIILSL